MALARVQRKKILDNIETVLETIESSDPNFQTDVMKVEQVVRHWGDVPQGERPWIGFMTGIEQYAYQPFNVLRVVLPITLMAYVAMSELEHRQDIMSIFVDDILVALNADQTRGSNATMTTIRRVDTDEGDHEGDGIIRIDFDVVYFRTTGASC